MVVEVFLKEGLEHMRFVSNLHCGIGNIGNGKFRF